jgi:polar amino acid transport system substrate-binding protein
MGCITHSIALAAGDADIDNTLRVYVLSAYRYSNRVVPLILRHGYFAEGRRGKCISVIVFSSLHKETAMVNCKKSSMLMVVAALAMAALSLTAPGAEAADGPATIKAAGKLRLAVFGDKPPFGYIDADGKHQGYDIYLARRLAQDLLGDENKIDYVLVEPASRIESLQADKADIVLANFTVTKERAKQVDFAKPYMKVAIGVVSPKKAAVTDVSQLKGKKLIVIKGTTADTYFSERHPEIPLVKYDRITEAFNALRDGRGVALTQDNTLLFAWSRENPDFVTGIELLGDLDTIAPAVKKGNAALLDWLNAEIAGLTAEGFFAKAYDAELKPVYGDSVDPESVLIKAE